MSQNVNSPEEVLAGLRALKERLFSAEIVDQVKKLDEDARSDFVSRRLELSEAVTRLQTEQVQNIRDRLQMLGGELTEGITSVTESLKKIEKAAQWAQGLSSLLGSVARIVPLG